MNVRVCLQGGHQVVISIGLTWGSDRKPSSSDEAYKLLREAIASGHPLTGDNGAYIRIERPADVVMVEIAR